MLDKSSFGLYHVYKLNELEKKMNVQDKIENGDYRTKLSNPTRHDFMLYHVYNKGKVIEAGKPANEVTEEMTAAWNAAKYTVETSVDDSALRGARTAYGADNNRLLAEFQKDLEEEHDMVGHPKAQAVFAKARNDGDGFREQADQYEELANLVK